MSDTFISRLIKAMELREMKPAELSIKSGISKASISQYMNGVYEAKSKSLYKLSQALDVDPAWLMGHDVPINGTQSIIELKNPVSDRTKRLQAYHESFLKLNSENQKKANEYIEQLLIVQESKQQKEIYLNAAHEIPGATAEDKAHDDAIMMDDSEWE